MQLRMGRTLVVTTWILTSHGPHLRFQMISFHQMNHFMVILTLASGISVTSRSPVQIGRVGITLLLSGVWLTWDTAHAVPTIQLEVLMILVRRILTTVASHLTRKHLDLLYPHRFRSFWSSHSLYRYYPTCCNFLVFPASWIFWHTPNALQWRVQERWHLFFTLTTSILIFGHPLLA